MPCTGSIPTGRRRLTRRGYDKPLPKKIGRGLSYPGIQEDLFFDGDRSNGARFGCFLATTCSAAIGTGDDFGFSELIVEPVYCVT